MTVATLLLQEAEVGAEEVVNRYLEEVGPSMIVAPPPRQEEGEAEGEAGAVGGSLCLGQGLLMSLWDPPGVICHHYVVLEGVGSVGEVEEGKGEVGGMAEEEGEEGEGGKVVTSVVHLGCSKRGIGTAPPVGT